VSSKKEKQKDSDGVSVDELILLPSGDHPLDLDLTDRTSGLSGTRLDISLIPDQEGGDLTRLQDRKELTLRSGKRHLKKIHRSGYMNLIELQAKRIIHPDMEDYSVLNSFR